VTYSFHWTEGNGAPVPIVSLAHWARGEAIVEIWRAESSYYSLPCPQKGLTFPETQQDPVSFLGSERYTIWVQLSS